MQILDAPLSPNEYQAGHANDSEMWEKLYPFLHSRIARWVCAAHVPLWMGQREAIIEDIVQDALLRVFAYTQRANRGEVRKIDSPERISAVIAQNCFIDTLRKDLHTIPISHVVNESAESITLDETIESQEQVSPLDRATEAAYTDGLFMIVAREIANFPPKQRDAILIDLAGRMHFDPYCPTPLQQAFAAVGIHLQEYQRALPTEPQGRARHAALLSIALKRLAALPNVRWWSSVA